MLSFCGITFRHELRFAIQSLLIHFGWYEILHIRKNPFCNFYVCRMLRELLSQYKIWSDSNQVSSLIVFLIIWLVFRSLKNVVFKFIMFLFCMWLFIFSVSTLATSIPTTDRPNPVYHQCKKEFFLFYHFFKIIIHQNAINMFN